MALILLVLILAILLGGPGFILPAFWWVTEPKSRGGSARRKLGE
jgi:hypothetical protein